MSTEIPTPRTDAEAKRIRENMLIFIMDELGCMADFASTLERELARTALRAGKEGA